MKKWEHLQWYVAQQLIQLGIKARPTKASGGSTELGDVLNEIFLVECKQRNTKNITINLRVWEKNKADLPINSKRTPILVLENKEKKRFVVVEANDFFEMLKDRRIYG